MEDPRSVNSPRRVLSLSRKRTGTVSFPEPDHKSSGFGVPGEHGPKPSEVYGFVGSISTVVATVIFLIWAYVPEPWLHSIGIYYYPSRYWALAVPTYAMVTIVLAIGFYIGLNFMVTPPPTSLNTIFDEYSREPVSFEPSEESNDQPIEPLSDIGINQINDLMFNDHKQQSTPDDARAAPVPYIPYDIIAIEELNLMRIVLTVRTKKTQLMFHWKHVRCTSCEKQVCKLLSDSKCNLWTYKSNGGELETNWIVDGWSLCAHGWSSLGSLKASDCRR